MERGKGRKYKCEQVIVREKSGGKWVERKGSGEPECGMGGAGQKNVRERKEWSENII